MEINLLISYCPLLALVIYDSAKIRISEQKKKYFLSFFEREYHRHSQRYGISAIFANFPRIIWKFQKK